MKKPRTLSINLLERELLQLKLQLKHQIISKKMSTINYHEDNKLLKANIKELSEAIKKLES